MTITIYGIPTCGSCRSALAAFKSADVPADLRDIRKDALSPAEIQEFTQAFGPALVNRASASWRALDDAARNLPQADLLATYPTVMKRPVIRSAAGLTLGWTPQARAAHGLPDG